MTPTQFWQKWKSPSASWADRHEMLADLKVLNQGLTDRNADLETLVKKLAKSEDMDIEVMASLNKRIKKLEVEIEMTPV